MSADNYIGVYQRGDEWVVCHGFASSELDDCQYRGSDISTHASQQEAESAAFEEARKEVVLEYGVGPMEALPSELCGRCYTCVHTRGVKADDIERCHECGEAITSGDFYTINARGTFHNACEMKAEKRQKETSGSVSQ